MNKIFKIFLVTFFISFLLMQIIILYYNNFKINEQTNYIDEKVVQYKSFNNLYEELGVLTEKRIINAETLDNKWKIKLQINGEKDHLIKEVNKLKAYKVLGYTIYNDGNESYIIVEII